MESFIKHIIDLQLPKIIAMESNRNDWRYQLLGLKDKMLFDKLKLMTRQELLGWLQWYDNTGTFFDHDCIRRGIPLLTKVQALAAVYQRIMRGHEGWDGYMGTEYIRNQIF
ncbi:MULTISPECIES: hypothetical protein [unclassified Sphingobacterium]|uniref:hypothetical protein n=1 Tax=unclassified Sphingobacterium TaxID=2609468 RepID=UPI0025D7ACF9|nr:MULTISPECIES: hypothetical protein [unclassified Sphingobacterium]